ncbi:hypothetical protein Ancab_029715 [Ancistrocladus abbreviatus]
MRSEEAERKHKSRKAIVLEPGNPSTKSQAKALAAVEVSPWKVFKQKQEPPFKKRKVEPSQVSAPPKAVHKSGFPLATIKGRLSASPVPSPTDQSLSAASPYATANPNRSQVVAEGAMPVAVTTKESTVSSERDLPNRASGGVQETTCYNGNQAAMPTDLESLLITLLKENPSGMTFKALEKAVGDTFPNSARKIEATLKKIATAQAPGRYLLKPGVESEILKKSFPESGSSPEDNHHKIPVSEDNDNAVPAPLNVALTEKSSALDLEQQMSLNSLKYGKHANLVEKIDVLPDSCDLFGEKKGSDNSEGQAGSSSDSGSDSDSESDSSDSGSQSSRRSRSPAGSGSGSSSDSDSDSSSNSKEGSDVDVDIMTSDDEKEMKHNGIAEKEDHGSEAIKIEKDLPDYDQEADVPMIVDSSPNADAKSVGKIQPTSLDHEKHQAHQKTDVVSKIDNIVTDGSRHEQLDTSERSKGYSKRGSNVKHLEGNSEHAKRSKPGKSAQYSLSEHQGSHGSHFSGSPHKSFPDRFSEDHYDGHNVHMPNRYDRNESMGSGFQKGYGYAVPGNSAMEQQQSGGRASSWSHDPETADRSNKHADSLERGLKYQQRSVNAHESHLKQTDKFQKQTQDEEGNSTKKMNRKFKDGSHGKKQSMCQESHYGKCNEHVKKFHMEEHFSNSHIESSPKASDRIDVNRSPIVNGRGGMLRRELSDLELGELREPLPDEPEGDKKLFERKGSFKHSEAKEVPSDYYNADLGKGRAFSKPTSDPGKPSSPIIRAGIGRNSEGSSKRRAPDPYVEDPLRPNRVKQSHLLQSTVEARSLSENGTDIRQEAAGSQQIDIEGYRDTHKKSHVRTQHHDSTQELVANSVKGSKLLKSNLSTEASERRRDISLNEACNGDRKRSESSSDENSSYSKYEKEDPELKGPINDFSQYKEYVQEYQEKYGSYLSLNKILEGYRDEFEKLGRDLESAKVQKDMERYNNIVAQLRESYRRCAPRHKRLKKIFLVLHEELQNLKQRIKTFAEPYLKDQN